MVAPIDPFPFSSDGKPTADEAIKMKSYVEAQRRRIDSIDEKILAMRERIQELKNLREGLNISCMQVEFQMAPMRWLPEEILGEIFLHMLPVPYADAHYTYIFNLRPIPHKIYTTMSLVCRRWKEAADSTPKLLTGLHLDSRNLRKADENVIRRWFVQSGSRRMDIIFGDSRNFMKWGDDKYQTLASLILENMARIRMLICCPWYMSKMFPFGETIEFPILEILSIRRPHAEAMSSNFIRAPKLRILCIGWAPILNSLTPDSFTFLRYLTVFIDSYMPAPPRDIEILKSCQNLDTLCWRDKRPESPINPSLSAYSLSFLGHLEFEFADALKASAFLNILHAPSLRSIELYMGEDLDIDDLEIIEQTILESIRSLFIREKSMSEISKVVLKHAILDERLCVIFHPLQHLVDLTLASSDIRPSFFSMLSQISEDGRYICPNLETLSLHDCHFDKMSLEIFVRARAQTDAVYQIKSGTVALIKIYHEYHSVFRSADDEPYVELEAEYSRTLKVELAGGQYQKNEFNKYAVHNIYSHLARLSSPACLG